MKYLIKISYDGSKYRGLQKLKKEHTIQGELEHVLELLDQNPVKVVSSGRTDRGVHAIEQCCTFELKKHITPFRLRYYIDRSTSPYLYVKECQEILDADFHARFSVKKKTYRYLINVGPYDPIKEDYVYNYNKALDIALMNEVAKCMIGPHDYRAFVTGKHKTCESIIDEIKIEPDGDIISIHIKGKAFYTYMIRNIVAIMVLVASSRLTIEDVKRMLEEKRRLIEYAPAPPGGLYLEKIEY